MAGCRASLRLSIRKNIVSMTDMVKQFRTRWINRTDGAINSDDIIDYMRADIISPSDAIRRMGLSTAFQEAILDPKHERVRLTESTTY